MTKQSAMPKTKRVPKIWDFAAKQNPISRIKDNPRPVPLARREELLGEYQRRIKKYIDDDAYLEITSQIGLPLDPRANWEVYRKQLFAKVQEYAYPESRNLYGQLPAFFNAFDDPTSDEELEPIRLSDVDPLGRTYLQFRELRDASNVHVLEEKVRDRLTEKIEWRGGWAFLDLLYDLQRYIDGSIKRVGMSEEWNESVNKDKIAQGCVDASTDAATSDIASL